MNKKAAARAANAFAERTTKKEYLAVIRGHLDVTKWPLASDLNQLGKLSVNYDDDNDNDNDNGSDNEGDNDNEIYKKKVTESDQNMTSRSESKLKEMKINVEDNVETEDTETDKKEFKVMEVGEKGYRKEDMKMNEDEKEMEKEFCDKLIWQKESMKISLNAHYQLFLDLMEREKEGVTLVREREEIRREGNNEKRDDTRKQKKDKTELTVKMREESKQEKGEKYVVKNKVEKEVEKGGKIVEENSISRTESENREKEEKDKKKNKKKQKKIANYLKDVDSGVTYLTPQTICEQLYSLSKYEKNSFEKYPKLRKLLRKALKV